jgi:hypothetical protein
MVDKKRAPLKPSARDSARLGLGEVDVIAPGLLHARFVGRVRLEHLEPLMVAGDQAIAAGHRALIIIDADDVHAYDTEVRKAYQAWIRANRDHIESIWVLFRSPLIKMGLGLVNAVTNGALRGFSDPEEFETAVAEATARALAGELRAQASVH